MAFWIREEARDYVVTRKILVVEDDPDLLDLLTLVLEEHGYEVQGLERGAGAVEMVQEFAPDLITLDLGLPDVDGQTVVNRLWDDAATRSIPIVVVSAFARDLRRTPQVRGIVEKPFDITVLLKTIAGILDPREGSRMPDPTPGSAVSDPSGHRIRG